jgi:hypothetical protein
MSRSPHPQAHRQNNGREIQTVHDHDVLSGRGVNIAQHPGNERFRALVTTRYDESYCSTFSTSEKRALAKEIIDHINNLDPPGRFLKRNGKSNSNRGLMGPWEELSPKEVLKKTCQALRDCNRNDRTGYAAAVAVPQDVIENAQERSRSGLTLKQYAEAAVARSQSSSASSYDDHGLGASLKRQAARQAATRQASPDIPNTNANGRRSSLSSTQADWLKRPEDVDTFSQHGVASHSPHGAAVGSYMGGPVRPLQPPSAVISNYHATPTGPPHMASVPVTNTPMQHPMYHHLHHHHAYSGPRTVAGPLRQPPPIPPPLSPGMYYPGHGHPLQHQGSRGEEDAHARIVSLPAPYSPVVWNRHKENEEIDDSTEPIAAWKDDHDGHDRPSEEDIRSAAAAAAFMNSESGRPDFDLLSSEDLPHDDGPLNIDELE